MKIVAGVGFLAVAGAAIYFFAAPQPADVYAMPIQEAYAKLVAVDFGEMSDGEKTLDTKKTASGNGTNQVTWVHRGDMAHYECVMGLRPLADDAEKTHVTVTCSGGGAGNGAAAGMAHKYFRNSIIERVDATLTGRPYDKELARGATAYRWPGDGVDGSLATATGGALKMDAEMRKMQSQSRQASSDSKPGWEKAEW